MNLQPAHETFIAECKDLLADMEEALLKLEQQPDDEEAITAVFRCAHTIKGSAGVFGFDDIVEFTHVMESLLEEIRAGEVSIDSDVIALLLLCGDHLLVLLEETVNESLIMSAETHTANTALLERLKLYLDESVIALLEVAVPVTVETEIHTPGGNVASDAWHVSLRFGRDVLRNGMDPLSFIRYMETMGEIVHIITLCGAIPDAYEMDPESCYLGLEIDFYTAADKKAIEGVFDFVRDDCAIRILPPHSKVLDYIKMIDDLPEEKMMLGELLVECGSLTENELQEGIILQNEIDGVDDESVPHIHKHKLGEVLVGKGVVQPELVDAALKKQQIIKEHRAVESTLMRVRADKLDELITQVGELVIAASGARLLAQNSGDTELAEASLNIEELVEQVREGALRLRMVPIGDTFNRFNRVVRDVARDLNKQVELVITGGETEVDKSMVDKISDPLMHLVRNALDHGIESVEDRQRQGKDGTGRVYLNAYHDSGNVVIEVADDGAGLDRDKILAKAIDKGLATTDQELTDHEIYELIMEPGFSTADAVTNVSGRGIGMDVVKRNVESLRGNINIDSINGAGTTIIVRLPLTLAIIDGFLINVGAASYVAPLDMVVECLELSANDRKSIRTHSYINLRDEVLPLLRLRNVFEVTDEDSRRENIVVIKYAGQRVGLVVDALLGEFQTVIKPLGKLFERLSGISGSTILGNGEVALILDVPTLVQQVVNRESKQISGQRARHPDIAG
jgi:two-component system chemotaxis sensor kinase CheA